MKVRFDVVFKNGPKELARIEGRERDEGDILTIASEVLATEAFLERLTGHRVHIEERTDISSEPTDQLTTSNLEERVTTLEKQMARMNRMGL